MLPPKNKNLIFKSSNGIKIWQPLQIDTIWATTWQNQQSDSAPIEDSDQPGHAPSLIRVFAVHVKKAWVLSYPLSPQRRLWSDWADAQADLSLRGAHMPFCWFCHVAAHLLPVRFNPVENCSYKWTVNWYFWVTLIVVAQEILLLNKLML